MCLLQVPFSSQNLEILRMGWWEPWQLDSAVRFTHSRSLRLNIRQLVVRVGNNVCSVTRAAFLHNKIMLCSHSSAITSYCASTSRALCTDCRPHLPSCRKRLKHLYFCTTNRPCSMRGLDVRVCRRRKYSKGRLDQGMEKDKRRYKRERRKKCVNRGKQLYYQLHTAGCRSHNWLIILGFNVLTPT